MPDLVGLGGCPGRNEHEFDATMNDTSAWPSKLEVLTSEEAADRRIVEDRLDRLGQLRGN